MPPIDSRRASGDPNGAGGLAIFSSRSFESEPLAGPGPCSPATTGTPVSATVGVTGGSDVTGFSGCGTASGTVVDPGLSAPVSEIECGSGPGERGPEVLSADGEGGMSAGELFSADGSMGGDWLFCGMGTGDALWCGTGASCSCTPAPVDFSADSRGGVIGMLGLAAKVKSELALCISSSSLA